MWHDWQGRCPGKMKSQWLSVWSLSMIDHIVRNQWLDASSYCTTVLLHSPTVAYCDMTRRHTPPLHGTEPGPTVGKVSVTIWRKEGRRMSEISPRRRQFLIMTLWMIHGEPVIDHGLKIQWVMFLRFSLFQNPAAMSLKSTNITDQWWTCEKLISSRYELFQSESTIWAWRL